MNTASHFLQCQIPAALRWVLAAVQYGQCLDSRRTFSTSEIFFRVRLPYLAPNRPAELFALTMLCRKSKGFINLTFEAAGCLFAHSLFNHSLRLPLSIQESFFNAFLFVLRMSLTAQQRFSLKQFIHNLSEFRGRHTELVSVYVPQGYELTKILQHLSQEQGTAVNIKSAQTRKNVIDALERMIQHLRVIARTPPNGLAVFSGNVAEREGQSDVQVWSVEPPVPVKTRLYRCDKLFSLSLLEDMLDIKEFYGLIVMDRRECVLAFLKGKAILPLAKYTSAVPGKTRAGGQSAQRFERLREGAAKEFFTRIGEHVKSNFFEQRGQLQGLLIGGPGQTKHEFLEGHYIPTELKQKVLSVKDLSYTDEFGLHELVEKSEDVLANQDIAAEKKMMRQFLTAIATRPNKVSYGGQQCMQLLEQGIVDTLLLSESLLEKDIIHAEEQAKKVGTAVEIISTETPEGAQLKELGGYGAFLRFEVSQ